MLSAFSGKRLVWDLGAPASLCDVTGLGSVRSHSWFPPQQRLLLLLNPQLKPEEETPVYSSVSFDICLRIDRPSPGADEMLAVASVVPPELLNRAAAENTLGPSVCGRGSCTCCEREDDCAVFYISD